MTTTRRLEQRAARAQRWTHLLALAFTAQSLLCTAQQDPGAANLALYRPVEVSSTDHAPTPGEFAVDGETDTGWRSVKPATDSAEASLPEEWIAVDLQAQCRISDVRLIWDTSSTQLAPERLGRWPNGDEHLGAYATAYAIQTSTDGSTWSLTYATRSGTGGTELVPLKPLTTRFVRLKMSARSQRRGIGLNEFQVLGTCDTSRPAPKSWRIQRKAKAKWRSALAATPDGIVPLNKGWELTREDWTTLTCTHAATPGVDSTTWYDATVPGTVLTTLVDQGVFPDPVIGLNNLRVPEALSRHPWIYRNELALPPAALPHGDRRLWLEFDGINHRAEVWLNANRLGTVDGAFTRASFDITDAIATTGTNALAVRIIPPPHPGIPIEKTIRDPLRNGGALGRDNPTFHASVGWDWIPGIRDRCIGIWSPVRLRVTGPVTIGDPQVVTDLPLPDTTRADLSLTVPLSNASDQDQSVALGVSLDNIVLGHMVMVPAHGSADAVLTAATHPQLALRKPRLWWPNGYGAQHLYRLSLTAAAGGNTSDKRSQRVGIRKITYRGTGGIAGRDLDYDFPPVEARYVRMLGLERGTQFGFSLSSYSVFNTRDTTADLALRHPVTASSVQDTTRAAEFAVDGNPETRWASARSQPEWICVDLGELQTIDRVRLCWEHAYARRFALQVSLDSKTWTSVKDVTYDLTQMELSVNGQRIMCRGGNWGFPEALLRIPRRRLEAAIRLHSKANLNMIRNWIGMSTTEDFYDLCDENGILVWNDFWLANPADGPDPDDDAMFLANVRDTIQRYRNHPSIAVWCGRNEGMPPPALDNGMRELTAELDGTRLYQPHSSDRGVGGGGPYSYVEPARYFSDIARGFKTEVGTPSLPRAESMRLLAGATRDPWPIDAVWAYHDFCPKGAMRITSYTQAIASQFGPVRNLDDFCRKAQMLNYNNHRAIFEAWNHHLWNDRSAVLLWMTHPAWPSTVWQIYDYWFDTGGAYFGTQKANEPVHVQLSLDNWVVDAINHTATPVRGTVSARILALDGSEKWKSSAPVTAAADARTSALSIGWPSGLPAAHLVKLEWRGPDGRLLSDNLYWRGLKDTDLWALDTMPKVKLAVTATRSAAGIRTVVSVTVKNPSKTPALLVLPSLTTDAGRRRVLPAYPSDGGFSLLPGEERAFTIECANADLGGKPPAVTCDGWNIVADVTPTTAR